MSFCILGWEAWLDLYLTCLDKEAGLRDFYPPLTSVNMPTDVKQKQIAACTKCCITAYTLSLNGSSKAYKWFICH